GRVVRSRGERPRGRAAEKRDERAALHSITSSARASSIGSTMDQPALKSTLDHLAKDRPHVRLRKRSQRLCANVSKGAGAQSKCSDGNIVWCVNDCDDIVLSQCPEYLFHSRTAFFCHIFEGVRPLR